MVKTLRIASYIMAALAACGVILFVVLALKNDPEMRDFLEKKGIIAQLKTHSQVESL